MSDKPTSLAAARLRECLRRQLDQSQFGYADYLLELAVHVRDSREEVDQQRAVLAFVLEHILRSWADELSPAALISRTDALRAGFIQPVISAVECLASSSGDPLVVAAALVAAIPKSD